MSSSGPFRGDKRTLAVMQLMAPSDPNATLGKATLFAAQNDCLPPFRWSEFPALFH
jgi:hypothetical protein